MVLSPNDVEVASSEKNQFKARVHKPYPISDQTTAKKRRIPFGAAQTYIAYIREYPPGNILPF